MMLVLTRKKNESVIIRRRWIDQVACPARVGTWVLGRHANSTLPVICRRHRGTRWVNDLLIEIPEPDRWHPLLSCSEEHPGGEKVGEIVVVNQFQEVRLGFSFNEEFGLLRDEVDIAAGMREGGR